MDLLSPREPVSSWTHAFWLLASLPAVYLLWARGRGDRAKQLSFLVYGTGLVACSLASTLYHSVRLHDEGIRFYALLDYIAIYVLIAGSYTPIVWNVVRGHWRRGILAVVWGGAALGIGLRVSLETLPAWLTTALYLAMGWGAILCYFEVARGLSHRALWPIVGGGLLYSVGAVVNLLRQPILWPGVFQAHELFHVFVVAASAVHYWFMLTVIAPFVHESDRQAA
jgi:hemolysin III